MNRYLQTIFKVSDSYLSKSFTPHQIEKLKDRLCRDIPDSSPRKKTIEYFCHIYYDYTKKLHQSRYRKADARLNKFISKDNGKVKIIWDDCLSTLKKMKSESIHLMVTSPPYYNARDYSKWPDIDSYLCDMEKVIEECYRVLDNHRVFVFNVGDIFDNDYKYTKSSWGKRRIPLGAYFTVIFERAGFRFVDDFIWDKGEVESQRHKNGDAPYPLYQYPMNCYEHIFIFYKHREDKILYPCPVCGCLKVNGNAYSGVGIKSWECKNLKCTERSKANRGKRFSARSFNMNSLKKKENVIEPDFIEKWRRDIIKINPVIKINSKGENVLGHTAPFPKEIPEYAVKMLSGVGDIVLDPFAGSFTTAIEANKLGRIGVGVELNKRMFRKSILSNIAKHTGCKNGAEEYR